jgi:hypothetical protein
MPGKPFALKCSRGHRYTEANTYTWTGDGKQRCKRCMASHTKAYLDRIRETKRVLDESRVLLDRAWTSR